MCRFKSGEAVLRSDRLDILTVPGEDSHTSIREYHKVPEANGGMADKYHTPMEFVPVRGLFVEADYDLIFDAGKPEWWMDDMVPEARRQFWAAVSGEIDGKSLVRDSAGWSLYLSSLTSLPEGVTLSAGGALDLSALTSLPEGVTLSAGRALDLSALTSLPEGVTLSAGRDLYHNSLTSLPKGVTLSAGRGLYLPHALQRELATRTRP